MLEAYGAVVWDSTPSSRMTPPRSVPEQVWLFKWLVSVGCVGCVRVPEGFFQGGAVPRTASGTTARCAAGSSRRTSGLMRRVRRRLIACLQRGRARGSPEPRAHGPAYQHTCRMPHLHRPSPQAFQSLTSAYMPKHEAHTCPNTQLTPGCPHLPLAQQHPTHATIQQLPPATRTCMASRRHSSPTTSQLSVWKVCRSAVW